MRQGRPCALAPAPPATRRHGSGTLVAVAPPAPYDAQNFLRLLGIDVPMPEEDRDMVARLTVSHALIAGTGYLWAPVVIAMADALCAFGVSRHWPEGARSFTTLNCSSQFLASAREGEQVDRHGVAAASRALDPGVGRHGHERDHRTPHGVVPLHADDPVLSESAVDSTRRLDVGGTGAAERGLSACPGPGRRTARASASSVAAASILVCRGRVAAADEAVPPVARLELGRIGACTNWRTTRTKRAGSV